jgi:23S rRNA-intervening sequence protein
MALQRAVAKTFRDLVVWQKAHQFVLAIYKFSASFPREELYGLSSQLRRASVSVAANIAEGFRKRGRADKARFMNTSERVNRRMSVLFDLGGGPGLRAN